MALAMDITSSSLSCQHRQGGGVAVHRPVVIVVPLVVVVVPLVVIVIALALLLVVVVIALALLLIVSLLSPLSPSGGGGA